MVVAYMNGSKKSRNLPSVTNNTKIYGIMGGTARSTGQSDSIVNHIKKKSYEL